jgi:hypothetical protein
MLEVQQSDTFSVDVYVNDSICFDLEVGVNDPSDSVFLQLTSSNFDLLGSYVPPSNYISGGTNLAYYDWDNNVGDTVFFNQFNLNSAWIYWKYWCYIHALLLGSTMRRN